MHRCSSGLILAFVIASLLALGGCLGKSSNNPGNGGVASVSLIPGATISLGVGTTQVFSATGKDAAGHTILGVDIQFVVESGSPNTSAPLSVATNGNACAGTWDVTISICNPGTSGIALVTAVIEGVSSIPTVVYVHQHIDSIQVRNAGDQPPQYDCFSQGQTWVYEGIAYSNNVDITNTVGPMDWSSSNSGVVTPSTNVPSLQLNQVQTTAKAPGITQLFASVSGTTSAPYPYTTCLIKSIRLQIESQGQAGNSITVDHGNDVLITATAVDTLYGTANNAPLANPPLTWSTTNPEVAAFSTTTNTTGNNSATARANLGGTTVFASCAPPTCNIGVLPGLPIYASDGTLPNGTTGFGTISIDVVTTTTPPTYTAWAATTDCQDQPGCASALFTVVPSLTSPIGTIVSLPRTPNSMMFNHLSAPRLYFGTNQGLMYVDVTAANPAATFVSGSPIPCNVSLCGKVLTISNDGNLVVVSDTVSTPSQVYIYNGSSTGNGAVVDLIIPGETPTAAAFSPDQLKLFILTNTGSMYIYSTVDALTSVPLATSATDVQFSSDGSFAYVAGTPASSVSTFPTCSVPSLNDMGLKTVTTSSTPLKIFPSPVIPMPFEQGTSFWETQNILALEPPNIEFLTAQFTQVPIPYKQPLQFTCNPPEFLSFTKGKKFNLGQGNFTPIFAKLVNDGNQMIVVAQNIPAVLVFDVANGTTTPIHLNDPLGGDSAPLSADASTDGSQVYVAACDQYQGTTCAAGSVHIVNTISQGDFQQVPYANVNEDNNPNMCNAQGIGAPLCLPNLIAIRPQ